MLYSAEYAACNQADLVSTNADKNTNSYAFTDMKTLGNGSLVAANMAFSVSFGPKADVSRNTSIVG